MGQQQSQTEAANIKKRADYQTRVANTNARLSEIQAGEAYRKGDENVQKISKLKTQVLGSQRAAFAAQGLEVGSGSAADIQAETEKYAELDIITAKNNAWKEAWGYKVSALQSTLQGEFIQSGAAQDAQATIAAGNLGLITSGIKAVSMARS